MTTDAPPARPLPCPLEILGPCTAGTRGRHTHTRNGVVYDVPDAKGKGHAEALAIVQSYIVEAEVELAHRVRRLKDGVESESGGSSPAGRMPSPFLNDALTSHLGMIVARAQVDALRTVEIHLIRLAAKANS